MEKKMGKIVIAFILFTAIELLAEWLGNMFLPMTKNPMSLIWHYLPSLIGLWLSIFLAKKARERYAWGNAVFWILVVGPIVLSSVLSTLLRMYM